MGCGILHLVPVSLSIVSPVSTMTSCNSHNRGKLTSQFGFWLPDEATVSKRLSDQSKVTQPGLKAQDWRLAPPASLVCGFQPLHLPSLPSEGTVEEMWPHWSMSLLLEHTSHSLDSNIKSGCLKWSHSFKNSKLSFIYDPKWHECKLYNVMNITNCF